MMAEYISHVLFPENSSLSLFSFLHPSLVYRRSVYCKEYPAPLLLVDHHSKPALSSIRTYHPVVTVIILSHLQVCLPDPGPWSIPTTASLFACTPYSELCPPHRPVDCLFERQRTGKEGGGRKGKKKRERERKGALRFARVFWWLLECPRA